MVLDHELQPIAWSVGAVPLSTCWLIDSNHLLSAGVDHWLLARRTACKDRHR
jgi:hypothetical protein